MAMCDDPAQDLMREWPQPQDGREQIENLLMAHLLITMKTRQGLIQEDRDPALQQFMAEEEFALRDALAGLKGTIRTT